MAVVTTHAGPAVVHAIPTDALYSILLLLHVACAVVGFGALALTGLQARRARRGPTAPGADGVRRFFEPGVNWAGRVLYGVPVFGFALIGASKGDFSTNDGFVVIGLGLWALSALAAEAVVWPGERRIQQAVSNGWDMTSGAGSFVSDCRRVSASAAGLSIVFVVAVVLMVARP